MILPIVTTTASTGVSDTTGSATEWLSTEQLPQNFMQLLALHLPPKPASETVIADSSQTLSDKDNKQKILDALHNKGIDLDQRTLNALLATVDRQTPLNDQSLSQRTDTDSAKEMSATDSQAVQALMAMLAPAITPPQQPGPTLSGAGFAASLLRGEKTVTDTSALFGTTQNADGTATSNNQRQSPQAEADAPSSEKPGALSSFATVQHDTAKPELALNAHTAFNMTPLAQPSASAQLNAQLGTAQWQDSLGQQIIMLSRNGQQSAQLRLHPEELGTLHISLRLDDNQAQIHLAAANSQVRSALEAALPHLRNAMAESGITLGQSSVASDNSGWQNAQQQMANADNGSTGSDGSSYKQQFATSGHADNEATAIDMSSGRHVRPVSGVDIFA